MNARIVEGPLDPVGVEACVRGPEQGAILTFAGVGRNEFGGRPVLGLHYEAHVEMAEAEFRKIVEEAEQQWPGVRVAIVHRVGAVAVGEASVIVAVGAPHRAEAYAASRYAIDALKARAPVWKKEIYADGGAWIANRP